MGRGMGKISTRLLNGDEDGDENELPGGSKPVASTSGASFLNCVSKASPKDTLVIFSI
jgi:hypothetical protein